VEKVLPALAKKILARPADMEKKILLELDGDLPGRLPATFKSFRVRYAFVVLRSLVPLSGGILRFGPREPCLKSHKEAQKATKVFYKSFPLFVLPCGLAFTGKLPRGST